jgi:hypothetical protein
MRRTIGLVFVLGVALGAQGADLGVAGRKLVLLDKLATAGRAKTVFVVRGDAGIAKGAAGDPGQLAGRFVWFYTDAPTSVGGAFDLANAGAGAWVANGRAAKYVNPDAALGTPTAVRVAIVQPGTRVKVVSPFALSDPGGSPNLFAGAPSAGGGISAILTITNGNDASVHRMCTRFATQDGSSVAYREIAAGAGRKLVARRGVAATCPTTTTTSTTTSTSTSVTSTTAPPCGDDGLAPYPICWGSCPAATPICAAGALGCECVAGTTPCGSASFPECDGACAAGEACQIGLDLGCTCASEGLPCAISGFPVCGGACPGAGDCRSVSTPDGEGCLCQPAGSTCLDSSPTCGGTCPPGQSCTSSFGGLCLCG